MNGGFRLSSPPSAPQRLPLAAQRLSRPAPGRLEVVRDFVNTRDAEAGTDDFAAPEGVRRWLAAQRLITPRATVGSEEVARVIALREALHRLILANSEPAPPAPAEAAALNIQLAAHPLRLAINSGRLVLAGGGDGDPASAVLLLAVAHAVADGTWPRMKCCGSHSCRWAFYDASPGLNARWCSMRICGAREKARRYRRRQARAAHPDDGLS
jgi:predicted RNA-binding Zn ribbon-like protein